MHKRRIAALAMVWALLLVAAVSSAITMSICGSFELSQLTRPTGGVSVAGRYARLEEVRTILESQYIRELDDSELVTGAIRGMLDSVGDPYTFYYTPEEMAAMTEHARNDYYGIGVLISSDREGRPLIIRVFENSPAWEAGLRAGDFLIRIEGQNIDGLNAAQIGQRIRMEAEDSPPGVTISVRRGDEELTVRCPMSTVAISRIRTAVLEDDIGYIGIYEFLGDDVIAFREAMKAFQSRRIRALVIDLRSNPGGLLTDVVDIADALLPEGRIVSVIDRAGNRTDYDSDEDAWEIPTAVLVNSLSASASEILAGALQDYGRAIVIGEDTYGKGIVQTILPFPEDGAGMQLTTAAYYLPNGRSIQDTGIHPNLLITQDESAWFFGPDAPSDLQLQAACEWLTSMEG